MLNEFKEKLEDFLYDVKLKIKDWIYEKLFLKDYFYDAITLIPLDVDRFIRLWNNDKVDDKDLDIFFEYLISQISSVLTIEQKLSIDKHVKYKELDRLLEKGFITRQTYEFMKNVYDMNSNFMIYVKKYFNRKK